MAPLAAAVGFKRHLCCSANHLVAERTESSEILCSIWTQQRVTSVHVQTSTPPPSRSSSSSEATCQTGDLAHFAVSQETSSTRGRFPLVFVRLRKKLHCGRGRFEMVSSDSGSLWRLDDAAQNAAFWGKSHTEKDFRICVCTCVHSCALPSLISATLDSSLITSHLPELSLCFSQFMLN